MQEIDLNKKPSLNICPQRYCFFWTSSGGKADMSGKTYESFEEAIEASNTGVTFINGGCACSFGKCYRDTDNSADKDWYEPNNRYLKKAKLPELFFCNPDNLLTDDKNEYKVMANKLWNLNV